MADIARPIAQRFAEALPTYDQAADIQRRSAADLVAIIATLPLPDAPQLLELGCGPGTLTRQLHRQFPKMQAMISDIAPAVAAACRDRLTLNRIHDAANVYRFVAMDGELPAVADSSFDLVCANLAVQWFRDLPQSLARLTAALRPGGYLAVTTLGRETFKEWHAVHAKLGLVAATPVYPTVERLTADLSAATRVYLTREELLVSHHPTALDFLQSLRLIGADFPAAGSRPLSPGALRRVLKQMDASDRVAVSYQIVTLVLQRL
ncbi:methyltransferase domain-containing protein [Dongia soli]|uniref:Methyltransferase domain-containing protein n=1 Tax=Dongia soli TaxID=600628 RepID=A0ABU5ED08_9PROT|nr:methyltransferase domain-containing protein [Dongia soli]MDY0883704.1 methyltransferase domain-containing protein [Dongia soli]